MKSDDIPKREFGKTGEMLTVIGPGGARFRKISWEETTAIVRRCYDLGINYHDCSHNYWGGRSEEVYGAVLPPFRNEVFVTTKCDERTREGTERELEAGLRRWVNCAPELPRWPGRIWSAGKRRCLVWQQPVRLHCTTTFEWR